MKRVILIGKPLLDPMDSICHCVVLYIEVKVALSTSDFESVIWQWDVATPTAQCVTTYYGIS